MALYLTMFSHFVVSVGSDSCSDIGNRKRLTKNPKSETFQSRKKILERFQVPRGFSEFFFVDFSEYGRCKFGPTYFVRLQNILSPELRTLPTRALLLPFQRTRSIFRRPQTPTNCRNRIQISSDAHYL